MNQVSLVAADAKNISESFVKLPYTTPVFKVHGAVGQLTQGGVISTRSDSGSNGMRPAV